MSHERILHQRENCDPNSIWCQSNCPRVVKAQAMTVYVIRYKGRVFHQTSHRDDHHRMLNRLQQHGHNLNEPGWEISE